MDLLTVGQPSSSVRVVGIGAVGDLIAIVEPVIFAVRVERVGVVRIDLSPSFSPSLSVSASWGSVP